VRKAIRTLEDVRARCRVDEDSDCWIWLAGLNNRRFPSVYVPEFPSPSHRTSIGAALWFVQTGERLQGRYFATCGRVDCCNPAHRSRECPSRPAGPLRRARISEGKRRTSKIPEQDVEFIRSSSVPAQTLAAQYGARVDYIARIRSGVARRPVAAPGSSVFTWIRKR
jgi:hypothetical protein